MSLGAVSPLLLLCDTMRHYDDMKLEDLALVTDGNKMHRFIKLAEMDTVFALFLVHSMRNSVN